MDHVDINTNINVWHCTEHLQRSSLATAWTGSQWFRFAASLLMFWDTRRIGVMLLRLRNCQIQISHGMLTLLLQYFYLLVFFAGIPEAWRYGKRKQEKKLGFSRATLGLNANTDTNIRNSSQIKIAALHGTLIMYNIIQLTEQCT